MAEAIRPFYSADSPAWKHPKKLCFSGISIVSFDTTGNFFYIVHCAGVVKLVDARDSKSRGAST
ncbi:MAG: hypothetical protein ACE144_15265, partial [Thermodesulfobacteriota bacterium]